MLNVLLKKSGMKKCSTPGKRRVMITFLIIALLSISLPLLTSARENAGNIWYFGNGAGLDFNPGIIPTALTDSISSSSGGSAIISDQEGRLLFYTDGIQLWNKQHEIMPNGRDLMGDSFADQPAIIVPNPDNPTLYYIFTVSTRLGLSYSTVNLTLNEGAGDVTDKNIRLWPGAAGKITAVKHQNGNDFWVIVPGAQDNTFHAYLGTASGVNHSPVVSQAGIGHSKCEFDLSGYVKASPDGRKLAISVSDPGFFELFDFDPVTGRVSNPLFLGEYEAASGIEFSPDSSKLYAAVVSWVQKKIYQFDLGSRYIPHAVQVIGESSQETRFRALQLGPDGRVYVSRENTAYVGVINDPNRLGPASDYVDEGLYLEGRVCRNDLPNFVQSFFTPPLIALTIHDTTANEAEPTATFAVNLSEVSRSDILVEYVTHGGAATEGRDYVASSGVLTIPAGALSGQISIPLLDDDDFDEGVETFSVELINPVRAVLADEQGIGMIQENDLVDITIADTAVEEGDGVMTFTVRLSQVSRSEVSVDYSTQDGTARAGSEYSATSGTLTIPAGDSSGTIVVDMIDDQLDEQEKIFTVDLSNPINAALADSQAAGTIRDDDASPTIAIQDVAMTESNDAMTFTVNLSTVSLLDVMVDYTTHDVTAAARRDYTAASGTVFIPAGTPFGIIMVDMLDDALNEQDETFMVELSHPVNAVIADNQAQGAIRDNDALPVIIIGDASSSEDEGVMQFPVSLSAVSGRDVSVTYTTRDQRALAEQDYEAASDTVTIPSGSLSGMIPVNIIDDANDEQEETFLLRLSHAVNAKLADPQAEGMIRDNDPPPAISIQDVAAVEDAGNIRLAVMLSHTSYQNVSVNYATTDGTASIADNDYLVIPDSVLTIPAGATGGEIRVTINEDTLIEGDEHFFVLLHDPVNATLAAERGVCTITDNDALPMAAIEDAAVAESGKTMTFTVRLSEKSQLPVIFSYATHDGTAAGNSDYAPVSGTMAIAPDHLSGAIVVAIIDDAVVEGEEAFLLQLSNVYNATLAADCGIGTISDNDR